MSPARYVAPGLLVVVCLGLIISQRMSLHYVDEVSSIHANANSAPVVMLRGAEESKSVLEGLAEEQRTTIVMPEPMQQQQPQLEQLVPLPVVPFKRIPSAVCGLWCCCVDCRDE
jgi:hypothetical protein